MKISCYATGHSISNVIMAAFAEGFEGRLVPPDRLYDGPAAMYGILRGTGEIIRHCQWVNREYWYVDHGYFRRGHYDGYYRVTKGAMQNTTPGVVPDDRWRALGLDIRPWRRDGRHVLVIPVTDAVAGFLGIDGRLWLDAVISEIKVHTGRNLIVSVKREEESTYQHCVKNNIPVVVGEIPETLKNCWCVVTYHSTTAMVALLNGIPVVTLGECGAKPCSWDLAHIESPYWPDREPLFHHLAYNQFTLEEIRNGTARKTLE